MNNTKKINVEKILITFLLCLVLVVVSTMGYFIFKNNQGSKQLYQNPKYIFLFIGDGMSSAQVELTEIYQNSIQNKKFDEQELLSFTQFKTIGLRKNYSNDNYIPDSAASATALATGILTYNGAVNVDMKGQDITPLTYELNKQGKKIGIITTMSLTHATPAAFYANSSSRLNYEDIANDLFNSGFDYFAGGTVFGMDDEHVQTKAKEKGYNIINDVNLFNNIDKNKKNIIISPTTNSEGFLPIALDDKTEFNLASYVEKGIEALDNDKGFFIMAESGLIDMAGHNNDARSVISEVQELNSAVNVALEFAKKHPEETLIIVTGDHETGGLTLGTENTNHSLFLERLQEQKHSYEHLITYAQEMINNNISYTEMLDYLNINYNIQPDETNTFEQTYDNITLGDTQALKTAVLEVMAKRAGINFSSTYHTADRIPIYAYGQKSEQFNGVYDSKTFNEILRKITQ